MQSAGNSSLLARLTPERIKRVAAKIDKSAGPGPGRKHPWTGAVSNGYGRVSIGGKSEQVHRVVWVIANGQDIPEGREIAHKCNHGRNCVNPDCLTLATHPENMATVAGPMSAAEFRERCLAHRDHHPIPPLPVDAGVSFLGRVWSAANRKIGMRVSSVDATDRKALRRLITSSGERTATLTIVHIVKYWAHFTAYAEAEYAVFNDYSRRPSARPVLAVLRSAAGLDAAINFYAEHERRREEIQRAAERQRRNLEWQQERERRRKLKEAQ